MAVKTNPLKGAVRVFLRAVCSVQHFWGYINAARLGVCRFSMGSVPLERKKGPCGFSHPS